MIRLKFEQKGTQWKSVMKHLLSHGWWFMNDSDTESPTEMKVIQILNFDLRYWLIWQLLKLSRIRSLHCVCRSPIIKLRPLETLRLISFFVPVQLKSETCLHCDPSHFVLSILQTQGIGFAVAQSIAKFGARCQCRSILKMSSYCHMSRLRPIYSSRLKGEN